MLSCSDKKLLIKPDLNILNVWQFYTGSRSRKNTLSVDKLGNQSAQSASVRELSRQVRELLAIIWTTGDIVPGTHAADSDVVSPVGGRQPSTVQYLSLIHI